MDKLHAIANAVTTIASKVNSQQLVITEMKKDIELLKATATTPEIDFSSTKNEIYEKVDRDLTMIQAEMSHKYQGSIAKEIAEIDCRDRVFALENMLKDIDFSAIEKLAENRDDVVKEEKEEKKERKERRARRRGRKGEEDNTLDLEDTDQT